MKEIPVLYENEEIYIINKPTGISVQGGQGISHPLDEEFAKMTGQKVYLVHRLDKDTSGLMIIAKTPKAASKWTKLISSKQVQKEYVTYCFGKLNKPKGIINDTLLQHGETKNAVTEYLVEKVFDVTFPPSETSPDAKTITISKIHLLLQTGRMHQIRIHLSKNNCPIIGDDQHGNFKLNKLVKKELKIKNMLLCSKKLTVPLDGRNKAFEIDFEVPFEI